MYPYYGATGQVGWIDDYLFDEELFLLGEDGAPFLDQIKNKAYLIRGKSWVNNHAHVLRAIASLTSNLFLCHYLNIFDYNGYVTGTTRLKLNQSPMRKIPIPLPPLLEQHRIVAKIEELFTKQDAGVKSLEKTKAQLKRYRQSVLKHAFKGKLTAEWRERHKDEFEPASVLLERIKEERKKNVKGKYKELPPRDTSDLPELPEDWVWAKVGEICVTTSGGTPSRKNKRYYGGTIPWLKSGELENKIITSTEEYITEEGLENSSAKIIPAGTLLMALYGATVGKLGILGIDSAINQAICAIFAPSQFVLLSFFSFKDEESRKFLEDYLDVSGLESVEFILKEPTGKSSQGDERFWNARGVVQKLLSDLWDYSLAPTRETVRIPIGFRKSHREKQLLLFLPNEKKLRELARIYENNRIFF